jgi:hypothetical protein
MAGRVFFDARYMFTTPKDGTMFALFSSIGNEQITKDYIARNKLDEALAYTTISGHTFCPIKDSQNDATIGTQIYYLTQSDFGGKLPQWLATSFVPKAIGDTYDNLIKSA